MSRWSLATKISLLTTATLLVSLLVVGMSLRAVHFDNEREEWRRNILPVVEPLSARLVQLALRTENEDQLREIAASYGYDVRIDSPLGYMTSAEDMPSARDIDDAPRLQRRFTTNLADGMKVFVHRGDVYLTHQLPDDFSVTYRRSEPADEDHGHLRTALALLASLLGLHLLALLTIKWLLRPLGRVTREIDSLGGQSATAPRAGEGNDEIKRLERSFGMMSDRVVRTLESKEKLLRDVSHEIRSPLARMRLRLEFIKDPEQRKQLAADVAAIEELTGELLDRARLDADEMPAQLEPVDLVELARERLVAIASGSDSVCLDAPAKPVVVTGDRRLLGRCLDNLLLNSLKHSRLAKHSIAVRIAAAGKLARLVVADSGARLPEDEIDRLFEPFYRTDESRTRATGGYGLGLAIVFSIVRAHNGEIKASGPAEGGLRIEILLPLAG